MNFIAMSFIAEAAICKRKNDSCRFVWILELLLAARKIWR